MRTVLVTGGSRGIGLAIASAFHESGDWVVVASRSAPPRTSEDGWLHVPCDVRHPDEIAAAVEAALARTGRLDVLVSSAGSSGWRPLDQVDEAFWNEMIDTNLKSVIFAAQAAARHLAAGGCIVNISSLAGKRGSANNAVYCAAKFGVNGITQALAKELGPRGIRVNAICPVYVRTYGLEDALRHPAAPPQGGDIDAYLAHFAQTQSALGRLPSASEVARACLWLASEAAGAVTGQCINVDCGVLPQ